VSEARRKNGRSSCCRRNRRQQETTEEANGKGDAEAGRIGPCHGGNPGGCLRLPRA
ncbi:unnamed protein product, partial [Cladocopium goreaui]